MFNLPFCLLKISRGHLINAHQHVKKLIQQREKIRWEEHFVGAHDQKKATLSKQLHPRIRKRSMIRIEDIFEDPSS